MDGWMAVNRQWCSDHYTYTYSNRMYGWMAVNRQWCSHHSSISSLNWSYIPGNGASVVLSHIVYLCDVHTCLSLPQYTYSYLETVSSVVLNPHALRVWCKCQVMLHPSGPFSTDELSHWEMGGRVWGRTVSHFGHGQISPIPPGIPSIGLVEVTACSDACNRANWMIWWMR